MICEYLLLFCRLPFHFADGFLCFLVSCSPTCLLLVLLLLPLLLVSNPENQLRDRRQWGLPYIFFHS